MSEILGRERDGPSYSEGRWDQMVVGSGGEW